MWTTSVQRSMVSPAEFSTEGSLNFHPFHVLSSLVSNQPTFVLFVQPLLIKWFLLELHTPQIHKPTVESLCLASAVSSVVTVMTHREFSLTLPQGISQNSVTFSKAFWHSYTCPLAIRWICNLLSWPHPLSVSSDFQEAVIPIPFSPQDESPLISGELNSCKRPQDRIKSVSSLDSAGLGLELDASTTWLWVPGQET